MCHVIASDGALGQERSVPGSIVIGSLVATLSGLWCIPLVPGLRTAEPGQAQTARKLAVT
jgi:hypothetical protein